MADQRFVGLLRVKNEEKHLERCLLSMARVCEKLFVLDDGSTDRTKDIIMAHPGAYYFKSPFNTLNESRDKTFLVQQVLDSSIPGDTWALMMDGDEELEPGGDEKLRKWTDPDMDAYSFRILFLWDSEQRIRVDGVYAKFRRPSMFKLRRSVDMTFAATGPKGLHCSSVPKIYIGASRIHGNQFFNREGDFDTAIIHLGYRDKVERERKFRFYNTVDPRNELEDFYQHIIQGDGIVNAEGCGFISNLVNVTATDRLKWAGPLRLENLSDHLHRMGGHFFCPMCGLVYYLPKINYKFDPFCDGGNRHLMRLLEPLPAADLDQFLVPQNPLTFRQKP